MNMEKTKLVCLGDSIATNYKLKVRSNTFTDLLARRLGLEPRNYALAGATTGYIRGFLDDNEEMIEDVKQAEIILISCGSNNVLLTGLEIMGEAAGIDPKSWRLLPKTIETLRTKPLMALKMVAALNKIESKQKVMEGVDAFKKEIPHLLRRIRELNSDAVIVGMTIVTLEDITGNPALKVTTKSLTDIVNKLNGFMKDYFPKNNVLLADLQQALRDYDGNEELSNEKENDLHFTDAGHKFVYRLIYDTITERYPEYCCEEGPDVIQVRKRKKRGDQIKVKENETDSGDEKLRAEIRDLIEETIKRDIPDYDVNTQFTDMGISILELLDIFRNIEIKYYDGKEVVDIPPYDYPVHFTPVFFEKMLKGQNPESILGHMDLLERYGSAEEKAEAEENDSPAMKVLKQKIYDYLKDDMVKLEDDTTYFGTLHMNCLDWYNVIRPSEVELDMRLEPARRPSPEKATLGEIAAYADKINEQ